MDFLARIARSGGMGLSGLFLMVMSPSFAGVVVTENVSAGVTSWPGNPIVQTVTNPAAQVSVGESFNAVGGCTNYAQTFTIGASNYTLQTISLYAGGGTGTGAGTNLTLRLLDLGSQTAPNPSPYTGTDLFNSGDGLAISYTPQTGGVLQFGFTGNDQVTLQAGHMYAFEVDGTLNSSSITLERTISDTYSGGAAYRNRSWINGTSGREFAMAVYATAAGTTNVTITNTPWVPQGVVFYAFSAPNNGVNPDGANPAAALALSGSVLCGTTLNGGTQGAGTAFYMTPDGSNFNTFRSFSDKPDAANPRGELATSGNQFFSTSVGGGNSGAGAVFVGQTNGTVSLVRSFATVNADTATNLGGASPSALLALSGGTLYGTTTAGGIFANGTVFSVTTNTIFIVLHNFTVLDSQTGTNVDGASPWSGLIQSGDTLYGTASAGGAGGEGVVFSVATNGANFTAIHSFAPLDVLAAINTGGAMPLGGLVLSNGTLYGTTYAGGNGGRGTIFSVQTNGVGFTVLHHFPAIDPVTGTNTDGASPSATLILSSNILFGTASAGGAGAAGTVFSLNTNGTQFATVRSFAALASNGTNADGAFPVAPVLRFGNSIYGTTFGGGPFGVGTVFSIPLPPPPALITNTVRNIDGTVTLYFVGVPNSTNVVQATPSLTPPVTWQNISTNIGDASGAWQYTDSNLVTSVRFYRSYQP